jgi:predicted ribosome quality control (RQC) complex YloA/Tae2 family protein
MKQKTSFSNFDVFIIVKELDERLNEGTIDNVY